MLYSSGTRTIETDRSNECGPVSMKQMGTKVIYFTISGRNEQAEFRVDALSEDVKGK